MLRTKQKRTEQAADLWLQSQIGEEERFGDLMRRMAWENKTAVISFFVIILMVLAAALAPLLTPYEENGMDLLHRLSAPSAEHLLGTDEGGRDVLTRLLFGARVSLLIGVVPALLALGGGILNVFLTLTLVNWANVARVVRAQTLKLRSSEFVEAAQIIGVSRNRIMRRHILPNCLPTLLVLFTLNIPASILTESSLSFLGLGIQPPNASWGLMINTGRQYLYNAPWLCFAPGAAIMLTVLAFNFLGNGLLDVLDPRMQKQ